MSPRIFISSFLVALVWLYDSVANPYDQDIRPFLEKHCVQCHGLKKQKAKLRLDTLAPDFDSLDVAAQWIEVMDSLNLGEMPPEEEPRPDSLALEKVVRWIASELRAASTRKVAGNGKGLRRLNRMEYSNTIRDLLGMHFLPGDDPSELLPPDPTYEGFDKVASSLMMDSSLLGNYYEAAKRVAGMAIVEGPPEYPTHLAHFEMEDMAKPGSGFSYVCGHGGCTCRENDVELLVGNTRTARGLLYPGTEQMFPVKGLYTIRVRASADLGADGEPVRMYVVRTQDRRGRIMEVDVTAHPDSPEVFEVTLPMVSLAESSGVYLSVGIENGAKSIQQSQLKQLKGPEKAFSVGMPGYFSFDKLMKEASLRGDHATALRLAARKKSEGWTGSSRPGLGLLEPSHFKKLYVDWVEIEGPLYDQWPPQSHASLFYKGDGAAEDLEYAFQIFEKFLPRVFRRPVSKEEIGRVASLIGSELERGLPFTDAIRVGLTYVLSSPEFLYLSEPDTPDLGDYELAARLSYFLWSSMPDDQLFDLAASGKLSQPETLAYEVARMLDDPKSEALVEGFAAQWLRTGEFMDFEPDQTIYRPFYRENHPKIREYMQQEPLEFFREVFQRQLSLLNFLDSDFAMVNEPLAKFYGLPGIRGYDFRKVKLPEGSVRGGLLGQAGIHLRGSDGIRTKPVNRGVYVREVLFNDPPAPPPPNAGEVEPNIKGERLTVRDRLLQHQQIEACASCHRGIDFYGLALENFDITGAWRDRQNGEDFTGGNTPPIDASGKLPNGRSFSNFQEFKALLYEQKDRFRRAFAEKLFLVALGRPVQPPDRTTVDEIARAMGENGDTFHSAAQALVLSGAFRSK
jgi:hypothetical protein